MYSLSKICVDAWIVFVYGNKSDKNVISHVDFFFLQNLSDLLEI